MVLQGMHHPLQDFPLIGHATLLALLGPVPLAARALQVHTEDAWGLTLRTGIGHGYLPQPDFVLRAEGEPAVFTAHFRGAPFEARPGGCHQSAVLGVDAVKSWGGGGRSLAGHPQQPPSFSIQPAESAVRVPECYRTGQMVENRAEGW